MHAVLIALMLAPSVAAPAKSAKAAEATAEIDFADERNQALLVLGAGASLAIVSVVAFTTGFDAERELQASTHTEAEADAILNRRTVAGWVAWPTAVLGLVGIGTGVTLLALPPSAKPDDDDDGADDHPASTDKTPTPRHDAEDGDEPQKDHDDHGDAP